MARTRKAIPFTAALIVMAGGVSSLSATALAQPDRNDTRRQTAHQTDAAQRRPALFRYASDLLKADVVNGAGESYGGVRDILFDRGTGRLEFILLKAGSSLEIGNQVVAIPYSSCGHDATAERLTLNMSPAQVRRVARFVPENWKDLQDASWAYGLGDTDWTPGAARDQEMDPYAIAIAAATEEALMGRIISVRRESTATGDQVVAEVKTDKGESREVVLGPSWFVMSHEAAPMRGAELEARVRTIRADGKASRMFASSATVNGNQIVLRDDAARPMWEPRSSLTDKENRGTDRASDQRPGRLMLLSKLIGATASPLDKDSGEIQNAVIECASGRIAVVGFDPNDNFLGIADTIRSVPWSITRVGRDGKVRFDADKAMLMAAQEMPSDISVYTNNERLRGVYAPFQIEPARFEPRDRDDHNRNYDKTTSENRR